MIDETRAVTPTFGGIPHPTDDMATRAVTGLADLAAPPRSGPAEEGRLSEMASVLRRRLGSDVVALVGGELAGEGVPRRGLVALTDSSVVFFRRDPDGEERIDRARSAVLWAEVGLVNVLTLRWRDRSPWRLTVDKGDVDRMLRSLPSEKGPAADLRAPLGVPAPTSSPMSSPPVVTPSPSVLAHRPSPVASLDTCGAIPKVPLDASRPPSSVQPPPAPQSPATRPHVAPGPAVLPMAGPSSDRPLAPPVGSFSQLGGPVPARPPVPPALAAPSAGWQPPAPPGLSFGGQATRRNGFAVASMVVGIVSIFISVTAPLALVFGYVARRQIRDSGGSQSGNGMALAGIVLGWACIVLFVIMLVFLGALIGSLNSL